MKPKMYVPSLVVATVLLLSANLLAGATEDDLSPIATNGTSSDADGNGIPNECES